MNKYLRFIYTYAKTEWQNKRVKPRELQLPITNRCNSRCTTCNIWKSKVKSDADPQELQKALEDPFFSEIISVGVNGGEPFLHTQIVEIIDVLIEHPKVKKIFLISNGLNTSLVLEKLKIIKSHCTEKGVHLYFTISLDGIGNMYDSVRGVTGGYNKVIKTVKSIVANRELYCDVLELGYTVSRRNCSNMEAVRVFAKNLGIECDFHLAVPNKRIGTYESADYSVLNDQYSLFLSREFFFSQFKYGHGIKHRIRSYLNYSYLMNDGKHRLAYCNYLRQDITIDENLKLYLCATASDCVGDLKYKSATNYVKQGALDAESKAIESHCDNCVHYIVYPKLAGIYEFVKELLKPMNWILYKLYASLLW